MTLSQTILPIFPQPLPCFPSPHLHLHTKPIITAKDFHQPNKMTLALLNRIRAPAVESELSVRDSGSGTLIQPQLQTWTHFNSTLCNLETAIECPAFQHPAQPEAQ